MITTKYIKPNSRPRGRPRSFDREAALEKAMLIFWQQGYEGTSIADLTLAMGITAPALYTAFHSKLDLYKEALALYCGTHGAATAKALASGLTALDAIVRVLRDSAKEFADQQHPSGCLISTAVLACARENEVAGEHTASLRAQTLDALRARITEGIVEGDLPADTNAIAFARYVGALIQGLSVQAQDGATEDELQALVDIAASHMHSAHC